MSYIKLNKDNIGSEHICCAIADKKCTSSYELKKSWLKQEFENGYVFVRLNERAKVFIEYGPAENAWIPVTAPNYIMLGCFWVSGQYKGKGHGKALIKQVIKEAKEQGKSGLVTVVGTKKNHFMSDTKWLLKQGFKECDKTSSGFSLLYYPFKDSAISPFFNESVKENKTDSNSGYVVYYSNRCPYAEFHVRESLKETALKRDINIKVVKIDSKEEGQKSPTPATIFSLFYNGKFLTTDLSVCMDSRFDKIIGKCK